MVRANGRRVLFSMVAMLVGASGCGGDSETPDPTHIGSTGGAEETPQRPPEERPTPDLMRRLAGGQAPFDRYVDSAVGITFLEYFSDASGEDSRADEEGIVKVAERLCEAELASKLEELRTDLTRRIQDAQGEPLFTCTENECYHPAAGEYDLEGRFSFRAAPDRGLTLDRITRIEGGPVTDEFVELAEMWAEQEAVRLASETCTTEGDESGGGGGGGGGG